MMSERYLGGRPIEVDAARLRTLLAGMPMGSLVAASTQVALDGRIVIAPSSYLSGGIDAVETSITVGAADWAANDVLVLAARGQIEWLRITGGPTGSGEPYTYTVARNLDGSGANSWRTGDIIVNTGAAGDGTCEIYSALNTIGTGMGPALEMRLRNSSTWSDTVPVFVAGNLNGKYGYATNIFGVAFGKDAMGDGCQITVETINGMRIWRNGVVQAQWAVDGSIRIGPAVSSGNIYISGGELQSRWGSTVLGRFRSSELVLGDTSVSNQVYVKLSTSGLRALVGNGYEGGEATLWSVGPSGVSVENGAFTITTAGHFNIAATAALVGNGVWAEYNAGTPKFRVGTVSGGVLVKGVYWDGSELLIKNGNGLIIDDDGLVLPVGTSGTALIAWVRSGPITTGYIFSNGTASEHHVAIGAPHSGSGSNISLSLFTPLSGGYPYAVLANTYGAGSISGLLISSTVGAPSSMLDVVGDVEIGAAHAYYMGDPTTNDSWRMVRSGNDLVMQRRESGSWVTKQTIAA